MDNWLNYTIKYNYLNLGIKHPDSFFISSFILYLDSARRKKMKTIAIGLMVLLAGMVIVCSGCTPAEVVEEGTIEVLVTVTTTDSSTEIQISDITAKISAIRIYREKAGEAGEWVDLYVAKKPVDLLQDPSKRQFLAFLDIEDSSYSQLSLVLERLDVTLSEGSEVVITPEPFEFTGDFHVFDGQTTTVVFNFNIDKSVVIEEGKTSIKPITEITWQIRYEQPE